MKNDFVKPKDQRELAHFGLARNCTFKNDFVKPKDQRELAHFGLARNRTYKNICLMSYQSPCGDLLLGACDGQLCLCDWGGCPSRGFVLRRLRRLLGVSIERRADVVTALAARQLDEYFAGSRTSFGVPLLFMGTDFQVEVWRALCAVPYGSTVSYSSLARRLGRPRAVRAVAAAVRANALSIFVPCHRVVGADGTLVGYAGGIQAKRQLLSVEGALML